MILHTFAARSIQPVDVGASSSTIELMSSGRGAWSSSTVLHEKAAFYLISQFRVQGPLVLAAVCALFFALILSWHSFRFRYQ